MHKRDDYRPDIAAGTHEHFLRALVDGLDTAVVCCDASGRAVLFNRAMARLWSSTEPALAAGTDMGRLNGSLRNPDGSRLAGAEIPLARAVRGDRLRGLELHLGPDGRRPRAYRVDGEPVSDGSGRAVGAVLTLHDVTERRLADRFGSCEMAVATALSSAPDVAGAGRAVLAAVGRQLSWPYGELWLADEVLDELRSVARWVTPGHQPSGPVPENLARGAGLAGEVWESGEPRWYDDVSTAGHPSVTSTAARYGLRSAVAVPIRAGDRFIGVLAFFGTAVEEPESALLALLRGVAAHIGQFLARRHADELAVELSRTRDDFLALVGHQLRTPLTSIASHTELLLADEEAITGPNRQLLESVDRNAHLLRSIVTNLLDLAGLESGDLQIERLPMDLAGIVSAAVAVAAPLAEPAGVKIDLAAPPVLATVGDPERLRQLIDELLANAVKYSPDGGDVAVRLERIGEAAHLTVADAGVGVPTDDRPRLFERFFRSAIGTDRGIPGTGLGLSIAHSIVRRHGGTISATHGSPGTTMLVVLPLG